MSSYKSETPDENTASRDENDASSPADGNDQKDNENTLITEVKPDSAASADDDKKVKSSEAPGSDSNYGEDEFSQEKES